MNGDKLLNQITSWHAERQHQQIIDAICAIPENERSDEIVCLLARALLNEDDFIGAIAKLDSISGSYTENPYFCLRYALALYPLHREPEALVWFKRAQNGGLEEIDEIPGTFLPKSVVKWIERAEKWAPRRTEKNNFEAARRESRKSKAINDLSDFDFGGFWDDCDYSFEKYVGKAPTDSEIETVETVLGYRLPAAYKSLIQNHNGGIPIKNCFKNPLQRNWTQAYVSINGIYGTDRKKPYSLLGNMGSRFWIEEWGYPDIGLAICDCPSGGHDMIFLDYSDCGSQGEPCVVHINQESDYEITYLADSFGAFVRGLVQSEAFEE